MVKRYSSLSLKEIGKIFDMDYTAVSQATRRFEDRIRKDNNVLIRVKDLQKADCENKSEIIEKNFKISLDIIKKIVTSKSSKIPE